MKSLVVVCLVLVAGLVSGAPNEARLKRSVIVAAPVVASVATVPVVQSHVVHTNPTTVVKTQQVSSGGHSSYSYSTETKSHPVVTTHTHSAVVAAAPAVAAVPAVASVVPSAYHYGYYPSVYHFSPYSYVVGK